MMPKRILVLLLLGILTISPLMSQSQKELIRSLDKKYSDWLDVVDYIITPLERKVFLSLNSNRERDALMELFWNQRDPTLGTPENEFKEEHMRRFQYANRYFRFGSPVPGWKTDRGRIHILLGPAVSVEEVITNGLHPVLIWDYFGNPENGLPTGFRVVFYKRSGSGQYRIYMPTIDGPQALLTTQSHTISPTDYQALYEAVKEYSTTVADVSLSLIPGEQRSGYSPSLQGAFLMSRIYDLPKRSINATYARNFMKYKGIVNVDVVTNYVNSRCEVLLTRDPVLRTHFLHFAFLPERLSVDFSPDRNQYYFNYELTVVLRRKGKSGDGKEAEVFKYTKNFPFYTTEADLNTRLSQGMVVADYMPVVPGEYTFSAVLQNSVNREITYFDRDIRVPASEEVPRLFGPVLSYRVEPVSDPDFGPFRVVDRLISIDPRGTFGMKEPLKLFFSVSRGGAQGALRARIKVANDQEHRAYAREYTATIPADKSFMNLTREIENPGNGEFTVTVILEGRSGTVLDSREIPLAISPLEQVVHPPVLAKRLSVQRAFMFDMMQATQYQHTDRPEAATRYFEAALKRKADFSPLIKAYAAFLLEVRRPQRLMEIIQPLKDRDEDAFEFHALRGKALYLQGDHVQAVQALLEANRLYDSDTSVLNALGAALANTGNIPEARNALEASLKLNPGQKQVKAQLDRLKGRKK